MSDPIPDTSLEVKVPSVKNSPRPDSKKEKISEKAEPVKISLPAPILNSKIPGSLRSVAPFLEEAQGILRYCLYQKQKYIAIIFNLLIS